MANATLREQGDSAKSLLLSKFYSYTHSIKECDRCVGWVEQSETQRLQGFRVLGFVPQPNLHL
ncbi:hypothetical protein [Richelia sinica]|uniref:hypothetical protein n=1 Tax=Richelia sinica TaxID=1357545 RepID=UPI00168999E4|nr:hypothetical protein [Richelia sinica]MBD2664326.1 hypothetical protein [Richelia sinica FACHB-800]